MSDTKRCPRCKQELPTTEFHRNHRAKDGLASYCKPCGSEYRREWLRKEREIIDPLQPSPEERKRQKEELRRQKRREAYLIRLRTEPPKRDPKANAAIIEAYKAEHPCVVCGESRTPCLDFHHLDPTTKLYSLSQMGSGHAENTLRQEIAKCVILCANCHRLLHARMLKLPAQ